MVDIKRRDRKQRTTDVDCSRPVEQMEGNTSFDAAEARAEGKHQGTYDGCAYAWDEVYAEGGVDVEPRC